MIERATTEMDDPPPSTADLKGLPRNRKPGQHHTPRSRPTRGWFDARPKSVTVLTTETPVSAPLSQTTDLASGQTTRYAMAISQRAQQPHPHRHQRLWVNVGRGRLRYSANYYPSRENRKVSR